ncbi:chromosomal replication initiator protein DnaA [Candidatus Uhrbacteria bacterium]|nr:chromosomal replication initiator protein DnaA [Candidatus Uhrbacteria bacterium]
MLNTQQLWQAVLGELELSLSKANFTTWFKNTDIAAIEGHRVVVRVPSSFIQTWLEKKYHVAMLKILQGLTEHSEHRVKELVYRIEVGEVGASAPVVLMTEQPIPSADHHADAVAQEHSTHADTSPTQQQKYTFDNFIVGKANELAHAACVAVSQNPGKNYNPLFIYGGVGLGKTHLLRAIGHTLIKEKRTHPSKILYVSCEKFINDFVHFVRSGRAIEFIEAYRTVDILLIDDIQFITGKEGTQEEFFHTFNELHDADKQIVLSSDRPPKAIPALEQRLLSRFEWGMIADIGLPDYETRLAILQAKATEKKAAIPHDVLHYIATTIQNNIRELEGALNRIIASHQLHRTPFAVDTAKSLLDSIATGSKRGSVTPKQLLQTVATHFDIALDLLLGSSRKKELVVPRQITMYLMREDLQSSFPAIGHELGGRDHTTAIHACTKIAKELDVNEKIRRDVATIRQRLYTTSAL